MSAAAVAAATPRRQVWSLIITFFGDAVLPRGGRVAARTVTEVMTAIGIEEGAVRTAFSRLVADGWVERSRQGRAAFYRLAEDGRAPFEEASRLIYAPPRPEPPRLALAVAPPGLAAPTGASALRDGAFLFDRLDPGLEAALREAGCLVVPAGDVDHWPEWTQGGERAQTRDSCQALIDRFVSREPETDLDAVAERTLMLHDWRRLVLRHHGVVFPPLDGRDDPLEEARRFVANRYNRWLDASERWLAANGLPGGEGVARRFVTDRP